MNIFSLGRVNIKVLAPMAGITNAEFAMKLIPFGFDTVTIGGYNLDEPSIEACRKIIERGRKEFNYPKDKVMSQIEHEASTIKDSFKVEDYKFHPFDFEIPMAI